MTTAVWAILLAMVVAGPQQSTTTPSATEAKRPTIEQLRAEMYEANKDKLARMAGHYTKPGVAFVSLPAPQPINRKQLAHLAYVLQLSDAQLKKFETLYEQYLDDGWDYRKVHLQPLWDESERLAAADNDIRMSAQWSQTLHELRDKVYAEAPGLRSVDDKFIEAIRPYLSDEQLPLLVHAHKLRQRQCARDNTPMYLGGRYDLTETLFEFAQNGSDMTPVDHDQFDLVFSQYETDATALMELYDRHIRTHEAENCALNGQYAELNSRNQRDDAVHEELRTHMQALGQRRDELQHEQFVIERRMHELNERYVKLLAEQLPQETGADLLKWWREKIYRYVYPDPYEIAPLLEAAAALETLSDDQRVMVSATTTDYRRREDALSKAMLDSFNTWNDKTTALMTYKPAEFDEYAAHMRDLQSQRHRNADNAVAALQQALDEMQLAKIHEKFAAYDKSVRDFFDKLANRPSYSPTWPGPFSGITD